LSTSVPFVLVDVFADTPLTGNPLAVVADAERLEEPVMRAVAREFNQSETTFVLPATRPGATWRLRSFTPAGAEVVGADTMRSALGGGSPAPGGLSSTPRAGRCLRRRSETVSCP
jgi:PhzF family phenazine biosynthesis protein